MTEKRSDWLIPLVAAWLAGVGATVAVYGLKHDSETALYIGVCWLVSFSLQSLTYRPR